jgi:transposase-like protein
MSSSTDHPVLCSHCASASYRKNGFVQGVQRYYCRDCGRNFTAKPKRIPQEVKDFALTLYLNNTGVRKVAKIVGVSPPAVLRWIKSAHGRLQRTVKPLASGQVDVIELDEIYTFIKKNGTGLPCGLLTLAGKSALLRLS